MKSPLTDREYWWGMAFWAAQKSKDPSRKVGSVIVKDNQLLATGYNGLAKGVKETEERYTKPAKNRFVVHAELNAVLQGARNTGSLVGATLYSTLFPCISCANAIIQAGITEVMIPHEAISTSKYLRYHLDDAAALFEEAGVTITKCDISFLEKYYDFNYRSERAPGEFQA